MPDKDIPPSVCQFIWQYLSSIEQLEILLLLASKPGAEFTAQAVYRSLLTNVASISNRLAKLADCGFIEKTSAEPAAYRFAEAGKMAGVIAELAVAYSETPVRVISVIYQDRRTVQEFADAFKLKRKP